MDPFNLNLMDLIDRQYLETPFYGSRKMTAHLNILGHDVNRKRIQRLMQLMGICAVYPGPNLSRRRQEHRIWPYLLKGMEIVRSNQVWSSDITYIRVQSGFMYLVAVMDWYSRYVLSWRLSNSLDPSFCVEALEEALEIGRPEIFNTDQGSQFTSEEWVSVLLGKGVKISMDSKGRWADNVFTERLWRTVKYEEVYLKDYRDGRDANGNLENYFGFYNIRRPHQSLEYRTPSHVYQGKGK